MAAFLVGLGKFTRLLINSDQHLAPVLGGLLPIAGHAFMLFVGIVKICTTMLVAARRRLSAYVVAAWLSVIFGNLPLIPGYFDVALRYFGLMIGALSLVRLSEAFAGGPS